MKQWNGLICSQRLSKYPLTATLFLVWDAVLYMCLNKTTPSVDLCSASLCSLFLTFWSLPLMACLINFSQTLEERAKQLRTGQVVFYRPDAFDSTPRLIEDVKAIGYHIIASDTRILLRSAYSSLLSYTIKVRINNRCPAICAFILTNKTSTGRIRFHWCFFVIMSSKIVKKYLSNCY